MLTEGKLDASVPQPDIAPLYDKLSGIYDVWGMLTESRARKRALELAEITDGQDILEVAVGTGLAFYEIVRRNPGGRNLGIDLSDGMLKAAGKRLRRLSGARYSLRRGSAFDLEAATGSRDLVVNNYMFDLIAFDDMDTVLAEFKRVLKKGGKLVMVNMTEGETRCSRIYDVLYRLSPRLMGGCRGVRLAEKLLQNGFTVETREYVQQMLFPSEVILARA